MPRQLIALPELLERLRLTDVPNPFAMADQLDVDVNELMKTLEGLTKSELTAPLPVLRQNAIAMITWGAAIGYFYAKKAAPIQIVQ